MTTTYWTGDKSNNFYDPANWSTNDAPQNYHDVNVSGPTSATGAVSPSLAIAATPSSIDVPSLTIGTNGTLLITAQNACPNDTSTVFSTQSFQVFQSGNLVVDTAGTVNLGAFNENNGSLTIQNNTSNVLFGSDRISGGGNLNLINSTLGNEQHQISVDNAMNVTLTGNTTMYGGFYAYGGTVTFDPTSKETVVLNGNESNVTTNFQNVSCKTEFAINGSTGVTPVSAVYDKNTDGSYTLNVSLNGGKTLTLGDVHAAAGFTPGATTISKDSAGDYVIGSSCGTSGGSGGGTCPTNPTQPVTPPTPPTPQPPCGGGNNHGGGWGGWTGGGNGWGCGNGGGWNKGGSWGGNWGKNSWGNGGCGSSSKGGSIWGGQSWGGKGWGNICKQSASDFTCGKGFNGSKGFAGKGGSFDPFCGRGAAPKNSFDFCNPQQHGGNAFAGFGAHKGFGFGC